jgi:hypothetical protein
VEDRDFLKDMLVLLTQSRIGGDVVAMILRRPLAGTPRTTKEEVLEDREAPDKERRRR